MTWQPNQGKYSTSPLKIHRRFARQTSLLMACIATLMHLMTLVMIQRKDTSDTWGGIGTLSKRSITTGLKGNGKTSRAQPELTEASRATWDCGVLLPPGFIDITILCLTSDLVAKHLLRLLAKNCHTAMTS